MKSFQKIFLVSMFVSSVGICAAERGVVGVIDAALQLQPIPAFPVAQVLPDAANTLSPRSLLGPIGDAFGYLRNRETRRDFFLWTFMPQAIKTGFSCGVIYYGSSFLLGTGRALFSNSYGCVNDSGILGENTGMKIAGLVALAVLYTSGTTYRDNLENKDLRLGQQRILENQQALVRQQQGIAEAAERGLAILAHNQQQMFARQEQMLAGQQEMRAVLNGVAEDAQGARRDIAGLITHTEQRFQAVLEGVNQGNLAIRQDIGGVNAITTRMNGIIRSGHRRLDAAIQEQADVNRQVLDGIRQLGQGQAALAQLIMMQQQAQQGRPQLEATQGALPQPAAARALPAPQPFMFMMPRGQQSRFSFLLPTTPIDLRFNSTRTSSQDGQGQQ